MSDLENVRRMLDGANTHERPVREGAISRNAIYALDVIAVFNDEQPHPIGNTGPEGRDYVGYRDGSVEIAFDTEGKLIGIWGVNL